MQFKNRGILLYVNPYRIVNEKSGEVSEGVSLRYIPAEDLKPVESEEGRQDRGYKLIQDNIPISKYPKIKGVPGMYDFTLKMKAIENSDKKTIGQLKLIDIDYIGDVVIAATK